MHRNDVKHLGNYIGLMLSVMMIAMASCRKEPTELPQVATGIGEATEAGTRDGMGHIVLFGINGRTFTTSDGRITLEVPAGALAGDKDISIWPMTNFCPGGAGKVYGFEGNNINFLKPVKITFNYHDSDVVGSTPEALTLAYQTTMKTWKTGSGVAVDAVNKKVSVSTTQLGDWSLVRGIELVTARSTVATGTSVELKVLRHVVFEKHNTDNTCIPKGDEFVNKEYVTVVKGWTLEGKGSLTANGTKATYNAPAGIPVMNPVSISVDTYPKSGENVEFALHRWITIW